MQRPARRESGVAQRSGRNPLRVLFRYVPSASKYFVALAAVIALVFGYRAAASASLFQARSIDVSGTSRTSADEISALTRRAVSRTGVWRADLSAISAELQRLPGVRSAVVTRVLPDGLRVRVVERVPVGVVRTAAGHFVWVDDEGVTLGEMKPADRMPTFFIRGWSEDEGEEARKGNAERIRTYLELTREWDATGTSERVSEVNLIDVHDVRAQLAGDDSQIEVRLGAQDFGQRLKGALDVLESQKQNGRASHITYIDLTQRQGAIVGFSTGAKLSADRTGAENEASPTLAPSTANQRAAATNRSSNDVAKPSRSNESGRKPTRDKKPNNNASERSRR